MQDTNQALQTSTKVASGLKFESGARTVKNGVVYYDDTIRWPIWQSALLVIGVCGGFWGGVIYGVMRLLG